MGSFTTPLVVMAVFVLGLAMISGLVIFADEVRLRRERMRRNANQEGAEQDWQEAARRELFRD
ncbi:hypothetical protein [Saccharopolyspora hattusasensis]|uniref:hypothetical protein n=1 Tax=Saccharopolyspora hattusasensis TaxID=1128679 RepID=UPI003D96CB6B